MADKISLGDAILNITGSTAGLNKALGDADKALKSSFGNIANYSKKIGAAMTVAGGAILGALGLSLKSAMDFGRGFADIATMQLKDLAKMKQGLKDFMIESGTVIPPIQELYDVLGAQIPEDAAILVMESAFKGARAGAGSLSAAINAGTSIMAAYDKVGIDAIETTKNMDEIQGQLAVSIKYGKQRMDDLGSSVGLAAGLFSQAGVSSAEYLSLIAALTITGLKSSEAVTALKQAMSNIIKPSKEAADTSEALGIQFNFAGVKSKGLNGFLVTTINKLKEVNPQFYKQRDALVGSVLELGRYEDELKKQIDTLSNVSKKTKAQKEELKILRQAYKDNQEVLKNNKTELQGLDKVGQDYMETGARLFGSVEAYNAVLLLTNSQQKTVKESMKEMENGQKTLNEMFKAGIDNDPTFRYNQMMASMKVLSVEIGESLIPAMKNLFKTIKPILNSISEWIQKNPELTSKIALWAVAIGGVMVVLGPLLIALPGIVAALKAINAVLVVAGLTTNMAAFGLTLTTLGATIGIVGGVVGIIAGVTALVETLYKLATGASDCGNWITRLIDDNFKPLGDWIDKISDKMVVLIEKFGWFKTLFGGMVNPTQSMIDFLSGGSLAAGGIARGGMTLVGERGPELVNMPAGARVYNSSDTKKMIGHTFNISVGVTGDLDDAGALRIARRIKLAIAKYAV